MKQEPAIVLTIAGSDSGGAAGLQADLRTFAALGAYGLSALTAVTAQNSLTVQAVHPLPAPFVTAQLMAVLSDYGARAAKTGFLGRVSVIEAVVTTMTKYTHIPLVIDPVLVNHKGEAMFDKAVVEAYKKNLLPIARLITPNIAEATLLTGQIIDSPATMRMAAKALYALGTRAVLIKGGLWNSTLHDLFYDGHTLVSLPTPHIQTENRHGSGDTLSAAICTFLGQGVPLLKAVKQAQAFTATAIQTAVTWQLGQGHGPVWPPNRRSNLANDQIDKSSFAL